MDKTTLYYLQIIQDCKGYYRCPRDPETKKRLGPLVGYAGRYATCSGDL